MIMIRIKIVVITMIMIIVMEGISYAQNEDCQVRNYQQNQILTPFSIPLPREKPIFRDLDQDGDPDVMFSILPGGVKILWIDDDDDMTTSDLEGDMDSDCVMIDVNNDGRYGGEKDLIVDWNDEDGDGRADIQIIVDNGSKDNKGKWESHFIWFFDDDGDGVLGYINWDQFKFEGWDHRGQAHFFCDYNGRSKMLKVHITTWNIKDLEYNWENPFLYYDPDGDGFTEMAIRVVDEPNEVIDSSDDLIAWDFSHRATLIQATWDLDNDTHPSNEQDFDMSLKFAGRGFDYSDQIHKYKNIEGLSDADKFFDDSRWRHMRQLVFADHDQVMDLVHDRGKWDQCWMVFDEDDDCHRWERVEFYDPKDPFKIGAKNGGLDHNPQADATGDRGEWDMDYSGKGKIYISPLDCRLHLYGAEKGYWRIDQNATYYQGWQGWRGPNLQPQDFSKTEPYIFGTVRYRDTDDDGYFDQVDFDMDGDHKFEEEISLVSLGIDPKSKLYDPMEMSYQEMHQLYAKMAEGMWKNAENGLKVAKIYNINTAWFNDLSTPKSLREKYDFGFWLSYYIYHRLMEKVTITGNDQYRIKIQKAYFSTDWKSLLDGMR